MIARPILSVFDATERYEAAVQRHADLKVEIWHAEQAKRQAKDDLLLARREQRDKDRLTRRLERNRLAEANRAKWCTPRTPRPDAPSALPDQLSDAELDQRSRW